MKTPQNNSSRQTKETSRTTQNPPNQSQNTSKQQIITQHYMQDLSMINMEKQNTRAKIPTFTKELR